jgi:uncharacterized membrane protein
MALMVLVIYPAQRRTPSEELQAWLDGITRRFRPFANFSLLILLVTGVVQTGADEQYGGLLDFSTGWSQAILGKHMAFFAMVGVVAFLQFGLAPTLERAQLIAKKSGQTADLNALRQREARLTQINFSLGLVVLFFTALATAY